MLHPSKYFEQVYLGRKREKKTCFDWIGVGEEEQRVSLCSILIQLFGNICFFLLLKGIIMGQQASARYS